MSVRVDTSSLLSGAVLIGDRGHGVLGSEVPSTGDAGPGYLYNDLALPADAGKEVRGTIESGPVGLTSFFAWEDSSFEAAGPDGAYTFTYRLYVDGADQGTATVSFTIGASAASPTPAAGVATVSAAAASTAAASITPAAGIATVSAATGGVTAATASAAAGVTTVSAVGASTARSTATAAAGSAAVSVEGSYTAGGSSASAVPAAGLATASATAASTARASIVPAAGGSTAAASAPGGAIPVYRTYTTPAELRRLAPTEIRTWSAR